MAPRRPRRQRGWLGARAPLDTQRAADPPGLARQGRRTRSDGSTDFPARALAAMTAARSDCAAVSSDKGAEEKKAKQRIEPGVTTNDRSRAAAPAGAATLWWPSMGQSFSTAPSPLTPMTSTSSEPAAPTASVSRVPGATGPFSSCPSPARKASDAAPLRRAPSPAGRGSSSATAATPARDETPSQSLRRSGRRSAGRASRGRSASSAARDDDEPRRTSPCARSALSCWAQDGQDSTWARALRLDPRGRRRARRGPGRSDAQPRAFSFSLLSPSAAFPSRRASCRSRMTVLRATSAWRPRRPPPGKGRRGGVQRGHLPGPRGDSPRQVLEQLAGFSRAVGRANAFLHGIRARASWLARARSWFRQTLVVTR